MKVAAAGLTATGLYKPAPSSSLTSNDTLLPVQTPVAVTFKVNSVPSATGLVGADQVAEANTQGTGVGDGLGVGVDDGVAVGIGVLVGVADGVGDGVGLGVGELVAVGTGVLVGVGDGVGVGELVGVGVGLGVGEGATLVNVV